MKKIIALVLSLILVISLIPSAFAYAQVGNGSTGEDVKTMQKMLNTVINAGLVVDGICGPNTVQAIKDFQSRYGLVVDGICGVNTWSKLSSEYTKMTCTNHVRNGSVYYDRAESAHPHYGYWYCSVCGKKVTDTSLTDKVSGCTKCYTPLKVSGGASIYVGEDMYLSANQAVSWESENTAIATVNQMGKVRGIHSGKTVIYAKTPDGRVESVTIRVYLDAPDVSGKTTISVGETVRWTSDQSVTWTSGYPAVASVDRNGNVTGHRAGQAHIVATNSEGEITRTTVTVKAPLEVSGKTKIKAGETVRWTANKSVTWTSGYPGVASVDRNGNITGHRAGQAHIVATTAEGERQRITLTVEETLTISGNTTVRVGETIRLKANKEVAWLSGYPAVASIDRGGNITAHRAGQAHIVATTLEGERQRITLTVVEALKISGNTTVRAGETIRWTANKAVTWTSGYPAVATVDGSGNITAHRAGQAHIVAKTSEGEWQRVTLTVQEPLSVSGKTSVYVGETIRWTANKAVTWTSGYPAVATVDGNGNITARRAGQAHIVAKTSEGEFVRLTLNVSNKAGSTALTLAGKTSAYVGETIRWTASEWVWWTSGNTAVATVDSNGNITAHRAGQTNITATSASGAKKTVILTVKGNGSTSQTPSTVAPITPSTAPTVYLTDLKNIGNEMAYHTANDTIDNYGNRYANVIEIHCHYDNNAYIEYLTQKQYTRFKAVLYRPNGETDDARYVEIVADGKTIYTSSKMTKDSRPEQIDVNISGYNDIVIYARTTGDLSGAYPDYVYLANAGFYK